MPNAAGFCIRNGGDTNIRSTDVLRANPDEIDYSDGGTGYRTE
jgi:hypothetical protein